MLRYIGNTLHHLYLSSSLSFNVPLQVYRCLSLLLYCVIGVSVTSFFFSTLPTVHAKEPLINQRLSDCGRCRSPLEAYAGAAVATSSPSLSCLSPSLSLYHDLLLTRFLSAAAAATIGCNNAPIRRRRVICYFHIVPD